MNFNLLTEEQLKIVKTTNKKTIVISGAAVGKTRTLVARVNYLIEQGVSPSNIVLITFTNLAAEELFERLDNKEVFVGTVHSYANRLLMSAGVDTSSIIESEEFDLLFELVKRYPDCIKKVEHLLWDEAQDSEEAQYEFILEYVKPDNCMLVGDPRQSIYQFRGARPDLFVDLSENKEFKTYYLNNNYRNGYEILQFAKRIIYPLGGLYIDNSFNVNPSYGQVIRTNLDYPSLIESIKEQGNWSDWFFLCATNADVDYTYDLFCNEDIPCFALRKKEFNNLQELKEKMSENTVKIMTIHQSKGLEAENVVVLAPNMWSQESRCLGYVAATRAKELLVWVEPKKKKKKKNKPATFNWE